MGMTAATLDDIPRSIQLHLLEFPYVSVQGTTSSAPGDVSDSFGTVEQIVVLVKELDFRCRESTPERSDLVAEMFESLNIQRVGEL